MEKNLLKALIFEQMRYKIYLKATKTIMLPDIYATVSFFVSANSLAVTSLKSIQGVKL